MLKARVSLITCVSRYVCAYAYLYACAEVFVCTCECARVNVDLCEHQEIYGRSVIFRHNQLERNSLSRRIASCPWCSRRFANASVCESAAEPFDQPRWSNGPEWMKGGWMQRRTNRWDGDGAYDKGEKDQKGERTMMAHRRYWADL